MHARGNSIWTLLLEGHALLISEHSANGAPRQVQRLHSALIPNLGSGLMYVFAFAQVKQGTRRVERAAKQKGREAASAASRGAKQVGKANFTLAALPVVLVQHVLRHRTTSSSTGSLQQGSDAAHCKYVAR